MLGLLLDTVYQVRLGNFVRLCNMNHLKHLSIACLSTYLIHAALPV